jgi:multiple sugar transport system permease protein
MAQQTHRKKIFTFQNIIWASVMACCLFVILSPLYIMLKYSISDKNTFVTGGKYPTPLWPFEPNMDQYRELLGSTCYKLTEDSMKNLAKAGVSAEILKSLAPMVGTTCNQKRGFISDLDKRLGAGFQISNTTLSQLAADGLPQPLLALLGNVVEDKPRSEKRFLRAIGKQTSYKLTAEGLAKLRKKAVPEETVAALENLKGEQFMLTSKFLAVVTQQIGESDVQKYKRDLLRIGKFAKVDRTQVISHQKLLLQRSFVGWRSGDIDRETATSLRQTILKEAGGGWSFGRKDFWVAGLYSLEIALVTVVLSMLIGAPAAFTLARYKFPGLAVLMFCIISIRLFPDICSVVPVAEAFSKPPLSLIPPSLQVAIAHTLLSLPYVIYILMGVFKTIPRDLEEQAYILGATKLYTFRHVIIPVALTGFAAASIYVFLLSWNEFIFAYFLLFKSPNVSLPVYLLRILAWTPQPNFLAAISMMLSLPVIVFAFAVQRYMISGMTAGAVK